MRRSAAGDSKRSDSAASPHKSRCWNAATPLMRPTRAATTAPLATCTSPRRRPRSSSMTHERPATASARTRKYEPVVLEQADDAAVVAVLAHRDGQPRQRQDVADERRPRDELVGAGAQRLLAPPAIADGDDGQLARHRLLAQPADQRQRLAAPCRRRRRRAAAARASAPWRARPRRRAWRRPCTRPLEAEGEGRAALAGCVENDQRLEVRHARQSIY